jgi:hypothetical protein
MLPLCQAQAVLALHREVQYEGTDARAFDRLA